MGLKVFPQQQNTITNKQGGICFRVDDVQLANRWSEFISVFRKYDYKATFALNLGSMLLYFPSSYVDTLLKMQSEGHEIMDHTPDHRTHYLINIKDTNYYSGREGVDHISRDTVCLRWDSARTTTFINEGLIDIDGNTVISRTAGDLYDIDGLNFIYAIYVPDINKIFRVGNIRNRVRTDVDTLTITSFWDERVNIGTLSGVQYHKLAMYDVRMSDSAIYLLADRSRQLFNQLNLTLPKTWIQTGGPTPQFYREELKRVLEPNFSYTAGATYPNRSLKGFNEYNPNDDKQFGMQWEDFRDDIWTLQRNKEVIADRLARHYVSIGASHFDRGGSLLGGWTGYLGRVDSLLMWCKENNIPVMTYAEWSDILYKTAQDPNINIFPKLNVDLDKNNIPDGYYTTLPGYTDGVWDTTDGVAESGFKSYRLNRTGSIAFINDLAGLEKGSNDFYIWTKGSSGSVITVYFIFPELGNQTTTFTFPASTSEWTKYDLSQSTNGNTSLNIPENVSYADIRISCTSYGGGWIGISGMSLKKKQDQYTIFVTQNDHGTISPGTITLDRGSNQTFLITPENGYYVDSVFVDNVYIPDSTTSYTFTNITDNHTIYAKFKILTYTINATAIGNGTIIPSGTITVNHGDNQTFTTSPADGFHVDSILVDGIKVDSLNSYTFINVIAPHTITAYFSINKYTITASAGPNGAISPSGVITVNHGDDTTFTFTPDFGYHVDSIFVDNVYIPDSITQYTFTNITDNHTIYVNFGEDNKIGTISGIVYHDLNLDSSWNNNEPGLEGCLVTLYNDGKIVDSVLTDAAGHFTFQNLPIGIYTIRERLLEGWKHASPPSGEYQDIVVSNNQIISINFGNFQEGQYIRIPISIYDQTKTPTLTIMFGVRIGAAFGIWGIDPSATEVDKYEGERELPPIAPQFIDARFINPEQSSNLFGNGSWNDVRGFTDVIQVDTYKVQITPGNSGYPITLRWQKETIENSYYGEVILNDLHGTIVDMKSTDSLVITSDNISNVLIIANQPKIKYLFKKGWNLVSLPKRTDTSEINSIFKQSNNYAYAFDPNIGYVLKGKLNPGIGYWLNFIAPQESVYIAGDERLSDTINVVEGWNLIGSLSKVMSVSEVMTDPSGIIESDFFKYDAGYSVANYLEPFSGYWIKVSNAGKLILNTNGLSKNSTDNSRISDRDEKIIKIKIRDSEGSEGTLTLALKDEKSRNYKLREIPPLPPDNIFDVRFKSNTLNEIIEENCEKEFPVLISTDKYPLTIRWEKKYQQFNFSLKINDQIIVIDEDGVVNIADSVFKISIIVRPVNEIITEYRLDQNYPNPFNPITTIRYYLPVRSNVTLKVYDILGQNLATLVEEVQDAGVRDIKWDAGSFSSSIYFYRLEATDVNDPTRSYTYMRKMLVIK